MRSLTGKHSSLYVILNALEIIHRMHTFTHEYCGGWGSTGVSQRMMGIITVTSEECDTLRLTYRRHKKTRQRLEMHHQAVLKNKIMIKFWSTCNQNIQYYFRLLFCLEVFKGPILEKNTFSLVSTYKNWSSLSQPTPRIKKANLLGLCSPPTGKTALLQAVQIQLLSLCNERRDVHGPASSARW